MKPWFYIIVLAAVLFACQDSNLPPAPLGERAALEQLASAYDTLNAQMPTSPSDLTPKGKLKFVQTVFKQAGYDYTATLQNLAQIPLENTTTYHKDMMQLVLLPTQGLSDQDTKTLYDDIQLSSVIKIKALYQQK